MTINDYTYIYISISLYIHIYTYIYISIYKWANALVPPTPPLRGGLGRGRRRYTYIPRAPSG